MATIEHTLNDSATKLAESGIEAARFEAELLLGHVLGRDRAHLRAWGERVLSDAEHDRFRALIKRRVNGEPMAYIMGEKEFWSLRLRVSPATLIPRAETELLVEQALARIPVDAQWCLADLGTGTGAIALALAKERPRCRIIAIDASAAALDVAQTNVQAQGPDNVELRLGIWFDSLTEHYCDVIVSNPPYIREGDIHLEQGDVRFEPRSALVAGKDGLDALRIIIAAAPAYLRAGGWLLVEHGYDQADEVAALFRASGFSMVAGYTDLGGQARITAGQWPEN
ncbi:MAG: hypothetical protein AMJ69_11185 [Gammaproteobacteria bacterium SG8_47]|nr:MAG: hypothetical protein AMJ69_11185 [Gammaproteobacteria bacterium SG8_47]